MKAHFAAISAAGLATCLVAAAESSALAQGSFGTGHAPPVVQEATRSDTSAPLRDMPEFPPMPAVLGEIFERPRKNLPHRDDSAGPASPDPVVQDAPIDVSAPTNIENFAGMGNRNGVLPPDTVGDIGPSHYVQMTNLSMAVYNRDGSVAQAPMDTNLVWDGFGGPCDNTNDGDPIVLYDHLADRWMISQFALPRFPRGPYYQCIAVSQTPDPTDSWHRYEFTYSRNKLNDYPKFGVWPDGYYMSVNQFSCSVFGCSWAGAGVVAFERVAMVNGDPNPRMVLFDLANVDLNLGGMLPADLDGPSPPPAGAPNPYMQMDDNAWNYSPDQVQIWNFHVDWTNTSNSSFTIDDAAPLPTMGFDSNMCGYSRNCIPQPGGTSVDAITDRLMNRLQYRNFGTHETLVTNQTVDVGGNHAGVRWYELRGGEGNWSIEQQGTYAPDSDHRWMGSAAMNGAGDIALGYSVSSGTTYPSIRYTGRLDGDTPGDMTITEGSIVAGSGFQTHSSGRWGDYSALSVDPMDDCTFWYTQEYYEGGGSIADWKTRIGSFTLAACGVVDDPPYDVTVDLPTAGTTVSGNSVDVTASASDDNGVTQVEFFADTTSIGTDTDITGGWSIVWDTTSGAFPDGDYDLTAEAEDTIGQTTVSASVTVTVDNVNDPPVASFTYDCTDLTCDFDGTGSNDPDGTIVSYDWVFGDTNGDTGATPQHTYAAAGTYTVVLTVTNDDAVPVQDTDSQDVTVSEAVEPTTLHVSNISLGTQNAGQGDKEGRARVTVQDDQGNTVENASVTGTFTGDYNEIVSGALTDSNGVATLITGGTARGKIDFRFCVDSVSGPLLYAPEDNAEVCDNF
jgi:PKD repeat protein